ncbi:unnamed protein product [Toxocara canis]|uniref:Ferric-chelate reductase 1 n=1 Tax=Toxocara canis TaxID=6265 RepID=A0A183UBX9_TOXCA|nr:unnamed protein product [Toxocara canis]
MNGNSSMALRSIVLLILSRLSLAQFDASECGIKKGCLFIPISCQHHNICRDIFSFAPASDGWVTMEIFNTASDPSSNYVAIGFSKDNLMGEEPVTHCGFNEGNIGEVHLSYNDGKSNVPLKENEQAKEEKTIELIEARREDGKMYCKFRQRIAGDHEHLPNLNDTYSILLAHGVAKDPKRISVHSLDTSSDDFPIAAPGKFNVAMFSSESTEAMKPSEEPTDSSPSKKARRIFVLIHGMVMLAAWFFVIAVAIASARYLRGFLPSKTPFGLRIWFHIHRTLNVIGVIAMLVAVFFAFMGKGWRWTGPAVGRSEASNTSPGAIHSLIGAVSVCLAVLQPIGGLLRCAPDARARPIFNWMHRISGMLAFILAAIAILIAAIFFHVWSSRIWAIIFIMFYILLVILFLIAAEVAALKYRRQPAAISFETNSGGQLRGETVHVVTRGKQDQKRIYKAEHKYSWSADE